MSTTDAKPAPPPPAASAPAPRWTEYVPLEDLQPDPRNPKNHAEQVLDESLTRFGYVEAVVIDERTGLLSAGHGRRDLLLRAKAADPTGERPVPDGIVVGEDGRWLVPVQRGWSSKDDVEAFAYLVTSNRSSEAGGWYDELLAHGLADVVDSEAGLLGTGYTPEEYAQLLDDVANAGGPVEPEGKSSLLAAADVTIGEPNHTVKPGEVWRLDGRHHLVCADLMTGHAAWKPYLADDVLFLPYPGPFVTFAARLRVTAALLVQPEPYLAGHILDKFVAIHGEDSIARVAG